jgi:hypothetical protein
VNIQNVRYFALRNHGDVTDNHLHAQYVSVHCARNTTCVFGYEFIDGAIRSQIYINLLQDDCPALIRKSVDIDKGCFQEQDAARPPTIDNVLKFRRKHLEREFPHVKSEGIP